jgi:hypothetical protein
MMEGRESPGWVNTGNERTAAMTAYIRAFFRSMNTPDFACLIADAQVDGQQKIVEELYASGVVNNIVRAVLRRIDRGRTIDDQINDYVQDATVVLIQIARQGRFDLTKSAGEIASYICLWIEQRVKRVARKDQRWRFSLVDMSGGLENVPEATQALESDLEHIEPDGPADREKYSDTAPQELLPVPWVKSGHDGLFGFDLKKSERNILSIFGSS